MKKLIVIAVMFAVLAGSVYGQAVTGWESPQSQSTAGRMRSAADDFIRPDSYTSAGVNDWFGMASFATTTRVDMGYAKKLEKLYIAAYYGGTFGQNLPTDNYTERYSPWSGNYRTVPVYGLTGGAPYAAPPPSHSIIGTDRPNNNAAILIGVADMGFRLALYSTYETFSKDDFLLQHNYSWDDDDDQDTPNATGTDYYQYKSFKEEAGTITPQLAWSRTKNLTDKGIKPYVTLDLGFVRNYTAQEVYDYSAPYASGGMHITNSQNYFQPQLGVGLGGFTIATNGGFSASVDLDWVLRLRAYDDNEYSYVDASGNYKTNKIKGFLTSVYDANTGNYTYTYSERGYVFNEFTPSISGSWSKDKLRLRFKLNLPVAFTNEDTTNFALKTGTVNGDLVKQGNDQKAATVAFSPNIRLAARWQAISKLALNTGARINIASITGITTEGETYAQGVLNPNSSYKTTNTTYGNTANQFFVGATFTPTDNLTVEATTGLNGTSKSTNNLNVFDSSGTGLFNFGSILVSVKF